MISLKVMIDEKTAMMAVVMMMAMIVVEVRLTSQNASNH